MTVVPAAMPGIALTAVTVACHPVEAAQDPEAIGVQIVSMEKLYPHCPELRG
jgi:hypothetical protein